MVWRESSTRNKGLGSESFDLERPATYYTRPMSSPWSKALDVDRLADGGARVDFAGPLAELAGLREARGAVAGSAHGVLRFVRERGLATAELVLEGVALLECQRCLQAFEYPFESTARIAFVGSEAQAGAVPAEFEPVLAEAARIGVGELVAQELLLALPIVPQHPHERGCHAGTAAGEQPIEGGTHRPLAGLGELLGRKFAKESSRS